MHIIKLNKRNKTRKSLVQFITANCTNFTCIDVSFTTDKPIYTLQLNTTPSLKKYFTQTRLTILI